AVRLMTDSEVKKVRRFILIALLAALSLAPVARSQQATRLPDTAASSATADKSSADIRRETFDIVWRTVNEKHFDPSFGGVDWPRVRERYAPRIEEVKTNAELYEVLQQMLGELGQSHFNIIPPEAVIADDVKEPPIGGVGIDVQMLEGQAVITRLEAESPAARAGLKTGFIIKQVDDATVEQIAEKFSKAKISASMKRARITRSVMQRINGNPDTEVRIAALDERNRQREVTLKRERLKGELSKRLGNFPPQYSEFEARRIEGGIGYIRFNIFTLNLSDRILTAIRSMNDAPGLVIDLRGNPGGVGAMASTIAGVLQTQPGSLGAMKLRNSQVDFRIFPRKDAYTGPVVVLIDGRSGSTSEVFTSGMQEEGRVIVVGERSVGAALPSAFQKLPTGALFQYAIADFKTPKGVLIEGRGVIPDIEVSLKRSDLLKGHDRQMEVAIEQIRKRSKAASQRIAG
ncbi:MAG TPA: S41 family peptidase, partial [Blastocatellia bacterium]